VLQATLGAAATVMLPACGTPAAAVDAWADALRGDTLALLGEVHDNAEHHRLRERALRRALAAGWRPAVVMEQFDLEQQDAIARARRERPRDARHLIAATGAAKGWAWDLYAPLVALALEHELPLWAGNVSRATASRVIRDGYEAALGAERIAAWNLQRTPDAAWQAAQEREIDLGHCGALPQARWAAMARAQFARDAALASLLQQHGNQGAVLLAGNGHVRRDIGVPRWLAPAAAARVRAVGFLEAGSPEPAVGQFDHVVRTARAARPDPCEAFKRSRAAPVKT
jgi:uncharacterized iron-regulated protein